LNASGKSETGMVRANNEDAVFLSDGEYFSLPNLYIVADGMGGHKSGEIASAKAIEFFTDYCKMSSPENGEILDFLIAAANYANARVYDLSRIDSSFEGMGTTFSACVYDKGKLYIAHIGDSRIYTVKNGQIKQLTLDHTYVNEMVKAGQMTAEQARFHHAKNMLTRALGSESVSAIDGYVADCAGSKILLCSDGLTGMITDDKIVEILSSNMGDNDKAVELLVKAAMDGGGFDNCTVVLFDGQEG